MTEPLLSVQHLTTSFATDRGVLKAVDDVSFELGRASTLAVVGESGSGKSVTALSILRLIQSPPGQISGGRILFEGTDLLRLPEREMRRLRGAKISMIFQEPMTCLNPVYTVGAQIAEALRIHRPVSRREARARAVEMLQKVGIPSPAERVDNYPHQLSGGMRQRVMIAMALICEPALLIADEPTTALDVTIQAQILELLHELQGELGMSILFITHDLGIVAEFARDVAVLYAGQVVETGTVQQIFKAPLHPYTRGLLASIPALGTSRAADGKPRRLASIEGMVPDLLTLERGCRFVERCALHASRPPGHERCAQADPGLASAGDRKARCYYAEPAA
ncbi:MAG TPA: ABC transporter ATP-binding protein [Polyangiaceae bacterium]